MRQLLYGPTYGQLGECRMYFWQKLLCLSGMLSINFNSIKLFNIVVRLFSVLSDFLFTCSINYLKRDIEIFDYIFEFKLVLDILSVLLHAFWTSVISCINILDFCVHLRNWSFIIMKCHALFMVISFVLKFILSNINISTKDFFLVSISMMYLFFILLL